MTEETCGVYFRGMKLRIKKLRCRREGCGYEWLPRTDELPRICPKCKSARWQVGRKTRKA